MFQSALCDVDVSKFYLDFENFWNKKTYDVKIIIINYYFLIWIKFQFLKEMYSSNQFCVNMQHRKKFRFDDEDRNDELFFNNSIDHIIKQFENVFFSVFSIKIIRIKNIYLFSKICLSLFFFIDDVFLFNFEFDVNDIFLFDFFFIRARNLIIKLFIF